MKEFLDKFSLSLILRQFFCGVVFFVPFFGVSGTTKGTNVYSLNEWIQKGTSNNDWSNPKVAALCVLACIVGTIIYHLEKNLWSYPLQCIFERTFHESLQIRDKDKDIKHDGVVPVCFLLGSIFAFFLLFVIVVSKFEYIPDWVCKFYPLIAGGMFLLYLSLIWTYLLRNLLNGYQYNVEEFQNVMRRTRAMWVMEEMNLKAIQQFASVQAKNKVVVHNNSYRDALACATIAKRLASWSDYIHSVQCMCFAWLLGVGCAIGTVALEKANIQHVSLLLVSVFFSIGVILLEAVFEYHRYHHLVYITAHFYRIHSSLDSHEQ